MSGVAGAIKMLDGNQTIRQVAQVHGKSIILKNVEVGDAEFILSLRLDPRKNRYISAVDEDIEKQREWIRKYQSSTGQAYFLICDKSLRQLGTVRLYDAVADSFSWGSWILKDGAPPSASIESAVLVYQLATACWDFRAAHFQVHQSNTSVLGFHEKFGAERTAETSEEVHLRVQLPQIEQALKRYARYLPPHLIIG